MDDSLYDEFGNYIGPDLNSSEEEEESSSEEEKEHEEDDADAMEVDDTNGMVLHGTTNDDDMSSSIVLHEDKKYYPDAHEVYGDAEVLVMEEDAQPIETPIIAAVKVKNFSVLEKQVPKTTYSTEFITSLMQNPKLVRNVAVLGSLHHGKTSLVDLLIEETHLEKWDPSKETCYTDTRQDEQQRKLSIKSTPVSLVLESSKGKSFLLNVIDCPGHVNFSDEATAGLQVADGAVIVVDALEGVTMHTETLIKHAVQAQVSIVLVVNKVDRLIVELKLPPADAYHKLMHTIEQVNQILATHDDQIRVSPTAGTVCFASSQHGWCFSLHSFAKLYNYYHKSVDPVAFAQRLWGNYYYHPTSRTFKRKAPAGGAERSFVQFILEPLYKIYSQVLSEDSRGVMKTMRELGIRLTRDDVNRNPRPLLRLTLSQFVGSSAGFVDMVTQHVFSPIDNAERKIKSIFTGDMTSSVAKSMIASDPNGPLLLNIVKLYSSPDGLEFSAFGRVYSGTVRTNQAVKVLGEAYSEYDDEDMARADVATVGIGQGRYRVHVSHIPAGNWVLVDGVDASITKTATITDANDMNDIAIFRPLQFKTSAVVKLAVEPLNPSELPKMLEGLRKINKSYPLAATKVEESGEHVILCTGELAADCIMYDLRRMYSDIEIKVADPVTSFCETVVETSAIQCFAETPNKQNTLTMIAEPLENGLANDIESNQICLNWSKKQVGDFFQTKYNWDLLAARSVWAFGPDATTGPNVLLDDTLPSEVDKKMLNTVKDNIVQGFQWGCREGPLCDEPIRNSKFKLVNALIASEPIHRGGGQIIPTARRVAYSSFLTATPRLMEPIYALEIQCPADTVASLYKVLARRRGHIAHDSPIPGSPLYSVRGFIPVIESFGFETDLRVYTQGQAFCSQVFDHWSVVPGDPLDRSIVLRPLEPSPPAHLAREFMVKTRRRKGLSEDVSINKFFDDLMLTELAKQDQDMNNLI